MSSNPVPGLDKCRVINTNDSILFLKYNNAKEELNRRLKNKKADLAFIL